MTLRDALQQQLRDEPEFIRLQRLIELGFLSRRQYGSRNQPKVARELPPIRRIGGRLCVAKTELIEHLAGPATLVKPL